jgi:hypothetical protein
MRGDTLIGSGSVTVVYARQQPDGSMKSAEIAPEVISTLRAAVA